MNTCPAHHTSTGLPGRHGNAATCPAAAASNHDAGLVRTATTALGVDRYTIHHTHTQNEVYLFLYELSKPLDVVSEDETGTT